MIWLADFSKPGTPFKPSTAEVTVTAGVKAPSASRVAPPIIAGIISHFAIRLTKVKRENIPPSWWLSALRAINTYLTVVIKVSVQITKETAPRIKSR